MTGFGPSVNANFGWLESLGFQRRPELDEDSPTAASAVYMGRHLALVVTLDRRNSAVDVQVVKANSGRLRWQFEGGYSTDVLSHLVRHAGYRGGLPAADQKVSGEERRNDLAPELGRWAQLLRERGQALLADTEDSLPSPRA